MAKLTQEELKKRIEDLRAQGAPEEMIQQAVVRAEKEGLVEKPDSFVLSVGKSMYKPFRELYGMQTALPIATGGLIRGAFGDKEGAAKVGNIALNQLTPQQQKAFTSENPVDAPMQGIKTTAGIVPWLIPGGQTAGQAVKFGALGGASMGLSGTESNNPNELLTNTAVGGVAGGVIGGLTYAGSKALQSLGKKFDKTGKISNIDKVKEFGQNEAVKGSMEMTKAQYQEAIDHGLDPVEVTRKYFAENPGASWDDYLAKNGIFQKKLAEAENIINQNAKAFGNNYRLDGDEFIKLLEEEQKALSKSLGDEAKARSLQKIINQAKKQYKNGITMKQAVEIFKQANSKFGKSIVETEKGAVATSAQKIQANALKRLVKEVSPEIESALRTQEEILTLRPIFESTRNKLAITPTLEGATLNPLQLFGVGEVAGRRLNRPEIISKMVTPPGTVQAATNPGLVSNALTKAGGTLQQSSPLIRQAGVSAISNLGNQQQPMDTQSVDMEFQNQNLLKDQGTAGQGSTGQTGLSEDTYTPISYIDALRLQNEGKDISNRFIISMDGKSVWNPVAQKAQPYVAPKQTAQSKSIQKSQSVLATIQQISDEYDALQQKGRTAQSPFELGVRGKVSQTLGQMGFLDDVDAYEKSLMGTVFQLAGAFGHVGVLQEAEQKMFRDMLPDVNTPPKVKEQRIKTLISRIKAVAASGQTTEVVGYDAKGNPIFGVPSQQESYPSGYGVEQ